MWISDSYENIFTRAESSLARGDYETAQEHFQRLDERLTSLKSVVLDRRPELRNLRLISLARQAEIQRAQGNFEQAIGLFERLIEMEPETRERWRREIALLQIEMGQAEAGLDELRAQAVAHPGDFQLWLTIGLECEGLGRLEEAEENLKRAAGRASDAEDKREVYLALFDFYRAQGRVEDALSAWEGAWPSQEGDPEYVFPLYQMMWEAGDVERARLYLRQEKNPLRRGFHQGLLAAGEGKPEEATRYWKRVAKMDPLEFEEGHEAWAEAALRVDWPAEEVIAALGAVLEAGNLTPRGLILQAAAEGRIGHTEHAESMLKLAKRIGLRSRPRQVKLAAAHWTLLDELVESREIKDQLRPYFEEEPVGEEADGE